MDVLVDVDVRCHAHVQIPAERFDHLLRAFELGAPPHGGIALGLCVVLDISLRSLR